MLRSPLLAVQTVYVDVVEEPVYVEASEHDQLSLLLVNAHSHRLHLRNLALALELFPVRGFEVELKQQIGVLHDILLASKDVHFLVEHERLVLAQNALKLLSQ